MTRAKSDRQRGLVYAWENAVVAPCDRSEIDRADAQAMVDAIWTECGLRYPPKVLPLPLQATTYIGRADRLTIELAPRLPSWCLLHELAHAMTSTLEGDSDGHGPAFMAAYVALLARYLRLDPTALRASAMRRGISLNFERRVTRSGRSVRWNPRTILTVGLSRRILRRRVSRVKLASFTD